ncbi:MotA/TolQ/ExbB proton channel family protein [Pseudomonas qingdaonensis]|nr:MotA/TolQ/ExbB proton channel family protein [Pseudomonas qingdaonensis]
MSVLASPLESIESAVIWLLVVFSVATWGLALVKGLQFARLKNQDKRFHKQFWAASSLDSAAELTQTQPGAAARVAQAGYAAIAVGEPGQANDLSQAINHQDRLERALRQQIVRERRSLETGLAVVASIGSTSPFIGLFGTVWGIMEALKGISAAGSASPGNRGRADWCGAGGHGCGDRGRGAGGAGLQLLPASPETHGGRPRRLCPRLLQPGAEECLPRAGAPCASQSCNSERPTCERGVLTWPFLPRTVTRYSARST